MDFIRLEKADEQAFQPLSEVYRMKAETKEEKTEKEERMEECLKLRRRSRWKSWSGRSA